MSRILTTALMISLSGAIALAQVHEPPREVDRHLERLLVLPFEQLDPDPQNAWIAQAVHRTLLVDLAELSAILPVTLPADEAAQLDRQDRQALNEAAASAGARLLLSGTYQIAGEQIRMTATLLDITREDPVAAMRTTAEMHELFELQDALGEHVRLLLHELDPALVEQDRLPVVEYPPAVEYRPPLAPVYEPYYAPPPTYVYTPTYIPYYYPPKVHCPIWHPSPFRTTTFFVVLKSKSKSKPKVFRHFPDNPPAVVETPPAGREFHGPGRPGRPIGELPRVTPQLTPEPPAIVADSPRPPSEIRTRDEREARRPGRPIAQEPRITPQRERSVTIIPRSRPERPVFDSPRPQPERSTTTPPRLTAEPPRIVADSPRPPSTPRQESRTVRPSRTIEPSRNPPPPVRQNITVPSRPSPEPPPPAAQRRPAPSPPQPARTTTSNPPRLTAQPPRIVADSPRPPAARTAPEPAESQAESTPRGPAGRRR